MSKHSKRALVDNWQTELKTLPDPGQAGTGSGGSVDGISVGFNPALIGQLNSGSVWTTSTGTVAPIITYGFTTSSAFATGFGEATGWSAFGASQKTAARQIMGLWDDLIKPSFIENTSSPNTADIKFSNSTSNVGFAEGYYPGQVNTQASMFDKISGSVWLNPNYNSGTNNLVTPTPGIYALGLNHAGNYNGGSPQYGNTSTGWLYVEDSRQYTIMSYFNASATGANYNGSYAQTPMVYDILAIQQIYGADYTTRAGDTTYGFNSNTGNALYDFTQNTSPILTIWDGNGTDTIDLSGWSSNSVVNLSAGSYSSVNGMTNNLAIAYNVDIENAVGGNGDDIITGNDLNNVLTGGAGNDTIYGAGGNDTISGGAGVDILTGGAGDDTIYFDINDNLALLNGGSGFDTLVELGTYIAFDFVGHNFERLLNIIADTAGAAWSQQTDYYNIAGLHYECDVTYNNGTRTVTEYDIYNTQSWSTRISTYAANGDLLSLVDTPDTGLPPANSAPVISSNGGGATAVVNIGENSTAVTTVTATDADPGTALVYSIVGGIDANQFTIDAKSGALSFLTAPNFEAPTDTGGNNIYDVQVQVSDGSLTDSQSIAVTVTNIVEPTDIMQFIGTSGNDSIVGQSGCDLLDGQAGNDTLAGLGGADQLMGGLGIDTATYVASLAGVTVSLATGLGFGGDAQGDTLSGIENLTGSNFDDTLEGNSGNNVLMGGLGIDTLSYEHATAGISVSLANVSTQNTLGAGFDTISGFENLIGSAFNDSLTGDANNNVLNGGSGNDILNGGAGADYMVGGSGNDVYIVDNAGDVVDETATDGIDTIQSSLSFSLSDALHVKGSIENLTLVGTAANAGTGNELDNIITGNSGNNVLSGLGGADQLMGGLGIDTATYVASLAGVTVSLATGLGFGGDAQGDTLSGIENLTGSNFDDTLQGNSGDNVLSGGSGHDTLTGGTGADTFILDHDVMDNVALGDLIMDYTSGSRGDTIDVTHLFTVATAIDNTIADYVRISPAGTLEVDADGSGVGSTWVSVATVTTNGVTGATAGTVNILYHDDTNTNHSAMV